MYIQSQGGIVWGACPPKKFFKNGAISRVLRAIFSHIHGKSSERLLVSLTHMVLFFSKKKYIVMSKYNFNALNQTIFLKKLPEKQFTESLYQCASSRKWDLSQHLSFL